MRLFFFFILILSVFVVSANSNTVGRNLKQAERYNRLKKEEFFRRRLDTNDTSSPTRCPTPDPPNYGLIVGLPSALIGLLIFLVLCLIGRIYSTDKIKVRDERV
jgi:hypothetical protein